MRSARIFLKHKLRLIPAPTQLSERERECLRRHAKGTKVAVEIGVMFGASTALIKEALAPDGLVVGIDPHKAGRLGISFERWVALDALRRARNGRSRLWRMDSLSAARQWQGPIDFLFIDADHSYEGLANDWKAWTPHLGMGSIVALHDVVVSGGGPAFGCQEFYREVALADPSFELLEEAQTLAVLRKIKA